jgi:hypothetical protein
MPKSQMLVVAAAFLLAGFGLYALLTHNSSRSADACRQVCTAQGKTFIVTPPGTAGRMVDGTNTKDETNKACTCTDLPSAQQ